MKKLIIVATVILVGCTNSRGSVSPANYGNVYKSFNLAPLATVSETQHTTRETGAALRAAKDKAFKEYQSALHAYVEYQRAHGVEYIEAPADVWELDGK